MPKPKKPKKKLTAAQRRERKRRKREFETVIMNGKQVRVRREATVDGLSADEFARRNADPVWLLQNGEFERLEEQAAEEHGGD